jgi:hypothetical protein
MTRYMRPYGSSVSLRSHINVGFVLTREEFERLDSVAKARDLARGTLAKQLMLRALAEAEGGADQHHPHGRY